MWILRRIIAEVKLLHSYAIYIASALFLLSIIVVQKENLVDGVAMIVLRPYIGLIGVLDVGFYYFITSQKILETHFLLKKYNVLNTFCLISATLFPTTIIAAMINCMLCLCKTDSLLNVANNTLYNAVSVLFFSSLTCFITIIFRNIVVGVLGSIVYWIYSISVSFSIFSEEKIFSSGLSYKNALMYIMSSIILILVSELIIKNREYL